ncbi:MAG: hypothetical protein LC689_02805 [Myxococcales bacterium]|nr:hypothetical protein [Myxococcales bacterium]
MHLRSISQPAAVRSVAVLFAAVAVACSGGQTPPQKTTTPPPQTDGGPVSVGDPGGQVPPGEDAGTPIDPPPVKTTLSVASGAVVAAAVPVAATVPDGTSKVEFRLDGAVLATVTAPPFSTTWDSYSAGNGAHTIAADAIAANGTVTPSDPVPVTVSNHINHVFIIVMENHDWSQIKGSSSAPYINQTLLAQGAHAEKYMNVPGLHPSLPNYIWLESGGNQNVWDDGGPSSHVLNVQHLTGLLEKAGVSWKAYQEDIPGTNCPLDPVNKYFPKHNPALYFTDVNGGLDYNSTGCISHVRPYTELANDLETGKAPQYSFITPNICNDMHDNSGCQSSDAIKNGDTWLSQAVPQILGSSAYRNGGALFITWDESEGGDVPIGLIALSPMIKPGYSNTVSYTHSSTLRSIEEIFGVSPMLGGAAAATDLADLFKVFP